MHLPWCMSERCSLKSYVINFRTQRAVNHSFRFIAPHFDYWSDVWHFCSKTASDKLEKVNERALRFVIGKMSFPNKDKWTSWSLEIICRLPKNINFVLSGFSSNQFPKHQLRICKRSFISRRIRWESCKLKETNRFVLSTQHSIEQCFRRGSETELWIRTTWFLFVR